jgi:hypothetical protein
MNRDIQELAAAVRGYVHAEREAALALFDWAFNEQSLFELLGLRLAGATPYDRNIDLKVKLHRLWLRSDLAMRQRIAHYYVVVWGRIKRNKPAKLVEYVNAAREDRRPPLQGVASWSKVLAAADPKNHAIFDARVSLSLNALQFRAQPGPNPSWRFPILPSQNGLVKMAGPHLWRRAELAGWGHIPSALVYPTYLRVLRFAARGLPGPLPLATAEMVLFARTEALAGQAGYQ